MIHYFNNHLLRMKSKYYYFIIGILMMILSIVFAIYFSSKSVTRIDLALVSQNSSLKDTQTVKVTVLKEAPPLSTLVMGRYDAIVIDEGKGQYQIETIKNPQFKVMIEAYLHDPSGFTGAFTDARGIGVNIVGFLSMFILLECMTWMVNLSDDIEKKQIERIAASPGSFTHYLLSHFFISVMITFIPVFVVILIMKNLFLFNIGLALDVYAFLILLLCFIGTSFALFIITLIKKSDQANMIISSSIMLSSILAGCFYALNNNQVQGIFVWVFPQKDIISMAQGFENGKNIFQFIPQAGYCLFLSLLLMVFSVVKLKKDYILKKN